MTLFLKRLDYLYSILFYNFGFMANTETDNYINTLYVWSKFEIDWKEYIIDDCDTEKVDCTDWATFTWSEIAEDYELMQLETKVDDKVDLAINQQKND